MYKPHNYLRSCDGLPLPLLPRERRIERSVQDPQPTEGRLHIK